MKLSFDGARSDKYIVIVSKVLGQIIRCSPLLVEVSDLTPVQIKIYSWSRHWYVERLIDSLLGSSEAYSGRQKFSLGVLSECQLSSAVNWHCARTSSRQNLYGTLLLVLLNK